MTTPQPTVFLDIDGVVCPNLPFGGMHVYRALYRLEDAAPDLYERLFAPEAIEVLNVLAEQFKPRFVLTTTWLALLDRHHFVDVFGRCGLSQVASSLHEQWDAPTNRGVTRLEAIKRWLEQHHNGEAILVLDDVESGESLQGSTLETAGRVVLCDVDGCLRRSHLEAARSALRRPIYQRPSRADR
ncbi:HAD domain-containing protein [Roseateles koreensis]|uniref:HAD domain-containing protein n=1 Tax=Roseateles koreensis TaxID=2987526 RepID=A0ABT5KTZ0_9BURK|nr:HAD domain-containing protein [Roseateles koreensis]MDC8786312.1 HAD domain-containing protein [Roseateles koreensis]